VKTEDHCASPAYSGFTVLHILVLPRDSIPPLDLISQPLCLVANYSLWGERARGRHSSRGKQNRILSIGAWGSEALQVAQTDSKFQIQQEKDKSKETEEE
jgi:hypothetical protein